MADQLSRMASSPTLADRERMAMAAPLDLLGGPNDPRRHAAWKVWASHQGIKGMESPLPIAVMMRMWIDDAGLRRDDAEEILRGIVRPHAMAESEYYSDFTRALARAVANKLTERARERAAEEQREADLAARSNAKDFSAEWQKRRRAALESIGVSPAAPAPAGNTEAERERAAEEVKRIAELERESLTPPVLKISQRTALD